MHIHTPLIPAPVEHARRLGVAKIYYKLENLQPSGSFKIRGISHLIRTFHLSHPNLIHVVSSSGGNAGLAAATAAAHQKLACTVFVPTTTPDLIQQRLRNLGADVRVRGDVWDRANEAAVAFTNSMNELNPGCALMVHPFDDERIWDGHSVMMAEICADLKGEGVDAVVCSVGGGGLMCGVIKGCVKEMIGGGEKRPVVVGVETEGAASFRGAWKAGKVVRIDGIKSIAKSLGALSVAEGLLREAFAYGRERIRSALVTDKDTVEAVQRFADENRMLVEPACGASLALVYKDGLLKETVPGLNERSVVVIIVCGGSVVTLDWIKEWERQTGV
ncbi:hypothetical protein HK101_002805 [Irineochytrium annulatum]|nr:hypothetical protein HK101_002805 [Irineochytrium annulatum]